MIKDKTVLDAGLEYIPLYVNIKRSSITKVATRPELFPSAEVIGSILSWVDTTTMIMTNMENKPFSSFFPAHIAKACEIPAPHIFMTH